MGLSTKNSSHLSVFLSERAIGSKESFVVGANRRASTSLVELKECVASKSNKTSTRQVFIEKVPVTMLGAYSASSCLIIETLAQVVRGGGLDTLK